ncbi:protein FAM47E [Phodopus roborovskii]|uniref:Fam47e protein n=1 Tax=Phodopus roborovskii TaxID=109678 RepID=A0AAU9ZW49_PHORO|nr:protein FAM47E [Phodopus roborovskii]CAH6884087.1 Fam47e [Phodopus roborovskii]
MAGRGQRLQPTTLASRLLQEHRNCGRCLENPPSKCFMKHKRMKVPGSMISQRWVFVREGLDDFRKDCPPHRSPKSVLLPHIHPRLPQATPKKRQNGLPRGAAPWSKVAQAGEAFLEDIEDNETLHLLALYPHLGEALPAELLLQVLEVLDPEKKLVDLWAYCQGTRKLLKEPRKLVEKCSSQVCLPKKMPVSHSGQWLWEERLSKVNSIYKDSLLHDNVRRAVQDFCDWAKALGSSPIDEELVLQLFDIDYQARHNCDALHGGRLNQDKPFISGQPPLREHSGCWKEPQSSARANPHKPKGVKMRYGAWYLKTNLWKKQRVDEPLVDPKISHKAQDANFKMHLWEQAELLPGLHGTAAAFKNFLLSRGYRMPRFLEKIYAEERGKSENINTPKKLTPTERNPGRR